MFELSAETVAAVAAKWCRNPFYAPDTVVLGLDIGIEGIGIAVRRGTELLYCKSLLVDLPEAKALAKRRALRAARHTRKNYRVRMRRLRALMEKHGLPWVSDDVFSRSDPFKLRYRAMTGKLASREALSLCIRSCVERRGYDYHAMCDMGAVEYPWGSEPSLSDAKKWIASAYIAPEDKEYFKEFATELEYNKKELDEQKAKEWVDLVEARVDQAEQCGISAVLKEYVRHKSHERRARGHNFPRKHVREHLEGILERHREMIQDYEGFCAALFLPNDTRKNKKHSIFYYNRKTPDEAKRHYERKVKPCPYAEWLDLPGASQLRCSSCGDKDIRRWALIDFVSNRTFWLTEGKQLPRRGYLPGEAVRCLAEVIQREKPCSWTEVKTMMAEAIKPLRFVPKNDWNKAQMEQLKDIVVPDGKSRAKRAGMSREAAEELVKRVTDGGREWEPERLEEQRRAMGLYEHRAKIEVTSGIYPQVRTLLGTPKRPSARRADEDPFATGGELQRIFGQELAEQLKGKVCPDYCVVECVRDAPANSLQKAEREKRIKQNRERITKLAESFGRQHLSDAERKRLKLFTEQGGTAQTPAICPFTGQTLGCDPFAAELELAHLFPNARGGLYVTENLVLTTRTVNAAMGNRTPKEATKAGLPGWSSWEQQLERIRHWSAAKKAIYTFEPTVEEPFPKQLGNMIRTAQLAAELRRLVALWMGIESDPEQIRRRIGNPSGTYTAAARRGMLWDEYQKDRSNNLHHRMDAAVMSCIPPAEGINDVRYGGIFYTSTESANRRLTCIPGLPLPDFRQEWYQPKTCPVCIRESRSKTKPLGDSTFWRIEPDGEPWQRTSLDPSKKQQKKKENQNPVDVISGALIKMGIRSELRPSGGDIEKWLLKCQEAFKDDPDVITKPLRLRDGARTPVKSIWKCGKMKGHMGNSPIGWSGVRTPDGKWEQMRILDGSNDRMEIWLGWNAKKKQWEYYKRVIPTAAALAGLRRMGLPWRGREGAPEYLIKLLDENKCRDLYQMQCGTLPPHAVRVGKIRRGDLSLLRFSVDTKKAKKLGSDPQSLPIESYGKVSAIPSNGQVQFKCVTHKDRNLATMSKASDLAQKLLGLPSPSDKALELGLTPPV